MTNFISDNVVKLDAATGSRVATVTAGTFPNGIAFDGANIWLTNFNSNTVSKI